MNKDTFSIEVEHYGDILRLELPNSIDTFDFYNRLDIIAHFLTFQNKSIENVYVERANEINNFEINESIKVLNGEINTLEDKILELENELKAVKDINTSYSNQIDVLMGKNATLYNELQGYKISNQLINLTSPTDYTTTTTSKAETDFYNKTFYSNPNDEDNPKF